jgi:hypothetical protein
LNEIRHEAPVEPAFALARFTCPHCQQLASQVWLNVYAQPLSNPAGVPLRIAGADLDRLSQNPQFPPDVREQNWPTGTGPTAALCFWIDGQQCKPSCSWQAWNSACARNAGNSRLAGARWSILEMADYSKSSENAIGRLQALSISPPGRSLARLGAVADCFSTSFFPLSTGS